MISRTQGRWRFGTYEFDSQSHELWKDGIRLKISGQPLDVLALLLECSGSLVTREELRSHLWSAETFVDFEHGLNTAIKRLRAALNDDPEKPAYIETVPKHGYRFIARIEQPGLEPAMGSRVPGVVERPVQSLIKPRNKTFPILLFSAVLFVLSLLMGVKLWRFTSRRASGNQRIMLLVLPFENLSPDEQDDYFGDGLTEETITELGQLSPEKLGLIARTSAMAYKKTKKTVGQIANELGVDYVVEGSVRREAQNVRVSVQLIRVHDQTHIWAHSYDREIQKLLTLEGDLGEAIAEQIQVELASQGRVQLARNRTIDPEAYQAYLSGRHFWYQFQLDSLNQAIAFYQQALAKDPHYAAAYAGLATAYSVRANLYGKPAEDYANARAAAERALALDDSSAEAHEAMAAIHIFHDWNWVAADTELSRCEKLGAPSQEYSLRAYWFEARGDTSSAIATLKRGLRLDPFNPLLNADLGFAYYYARQPDSLMSQYEKTREADPNFPLAKRMRALAYREKADLSAAAAEYRRLGDQVTLAEVQAEQGNACAARALLHHFLKDSLKATPNAPAIVGLCHAVGDKDCVVNWLEKEYTDRDPWLIWLRLDPANDDLRSDPRFQQLTSRIGLQ